MMQRKLIAQGGILDFDSGFLSHQEADHLFRVFQEDVEWEQKHYKNYRTGESFPQPRLTAWFADDPKMAYSYSGVTQKVQYWLPELLELKNKVEKVTNASYNSVLLNYYRDGKDSVGMHADDEKELGVNATIASVSLGCARRFVLGCYKQNPNWEPPPGEDTYYISPFQDQAEGSLYVPGSSHEYELTHGSLLVMSGTTQHYWKHEVPKAILTPGQIRMGVQPVGARINLTFRQFTV